MACRVPKSIIDGDNLVITVPGNDSSEARNLGQTARLYIRPVIHVMPAAGQRAAAAHRRSCGRTARGSAGAPGAPPGAPPGVPGLPDRSAGAGRAGGPAGRRRTATRAAHAGSGAAAAPLSFRAAGPARTGAATGTTAAEPAAGAGAATGSGNTGTSARRAGHVAAGEAPRAQRIADEKELRQSTDQQIQILALQFQATRCGEDDVLAGNDDPNLPLITCSQDGKEVYLLDKSIISGEQIENASSGLDQQQGEYVVDVQFKGDATKIWADFTAANVGTQTAFVLDSEVVSAPEIREPIPGGRTQITGQFNETTRARTGQRAEVRLAAAVLRVVGGRNRLGDTGFDIAEGRFDRGCGRPRAGAALLTALLPGAWAY